MGDGYAAASIDASAWDEQPTAQTLTGNVSCFSSGLPTDETGKQNKKTTEAMLSAKAEAQSNNEVLSDAVSTAAVDNGTPFSGEGSTGRPNIVEAERATRQGIVDIAAQRRVNITAEAFGRGDVMTVMSPKYIVFTWA